MGLHKEYFRSRVHFHICSRELEACDVDGRG